MAFYLPKVEKESLSLLNDNNLLSLYNDIEIPLCDILARMEIEGFPLNKDVLSTINKEYQNKLDDLTKEIYSLAGYEFNISSPKQVAELLYTKLNLPHNKKESTSVEVLNELSSLNPIVPLIIEYRKYSKLISTYTSGLLAYLHEDNKIHTIFNQALTQTGRLSSSDPNLQNISTRTEEGKAVRKAFFYDDDENYLLSLDYSQVEYRVLAAMSSCSDLIDVFNNDEDIHTATAMKVFHLEKDQVTSEIRRQAKAINFGIIYGISDWGLADKIYSSPKEAKAIIEKFYQEYPDIKNYFVNTINKAKENGYCETIYGRRRYVPELKSDNYMTREFGKRVCMNAPIQGSAADIMKICMIKVDKFLKENNYKTKVVLQIHDELIYKVPKEEKDIIVPLLKDVMENCVKLKVKLHVEGSLAKTWFDCK
jgi:DNA polymerase-1